MNDDCSGVSHDTINWVGHSGTRRRRRRLGGALVSAAVLLIAACGGDDDGATTATTTPASGDTTATTVADAGQPIRGGRMVIGIADEAALGYNPVGGSFGPGANTVAMSIYDTLAAYAADGSVHPYLAESMEPNADATVWTVTMRPGVTFHDGTPVDAAAVKAQFERHAANGQELVPGFSVEVVSDLVAEFHFPTPYGAFPAQMTTQFGWITSPTAADELGDAFGDQPVGSGPYVFKEWVKDDHLTVVRNENYWRDDVAYLDEIEFRPIIDEETRLAALAAGDIDAAQVTDVSAARDLDGVNLVESKVGIDTILLNEQLPLFQDARVREALALALDVDAIIDTVYDGVGDRATGPIPSDNTYYHPTDPKPYDPDRARELLAEYTADTGEDVEIKFVFDTSSAAQEVAQLIQSYWQDVGAQVELQAPLQTSDLNTGYFTHEYEAGYFSIPALIDPDPWLYVMFRTDGILNFGGLSNLPDLDAAVIAGHENTDDAARKTGYEEAQNILAEGTHWIFLREGVSASAARDGVEGLQDWPLPDGTAGLSKQFWIPFEVDALWLAE